MTIDWKTVLDACSGDVRRLSYVDRYTTIPVTFKENVAEHSYWVTLYSLIIHHAMEQPEYLTGPILSYALVHDLSECMSGDLVRTFKYLTPELKLAVSNAEEIIESGIPESIRNEFSSIKNIGDPSDRAYAKSVVKTADFVSLHQYMIREISRGNEEIGPFFRRMQIDLKNAGNEAADSNDIRIRELSRLFFLMATTTTHGHRTS